MAISPQTPDHSLKDYNADEAYELPLPGTFIVLPDATIGFAFVDADYTVRMEPGKKCAARGKIVAKNRRTAAPGS